MNANKLFNEIMRGQWFLDVHNLESYNAWMETYLRGGQVFDKEPVEAVNRLISSSTADESSEETEENYAYISMHGVLTRFGGMCLYGTEDYANMLDEIESNPDIAGTVIHFNGPGGSTDAMIPILDFKTRKTKPIVGLVGYAGSATYWSAVELSDYLIAEHEVLTAVGSVGVMWAYADFKPQLEKKGVVFHEIYADESTEKNKVFNLALEGKYEQIKTEMLSPMAKAFQQAVRANRPQLVEEEGVLTGKMFQAAKAKEYGMIDAVGNLQDALKMVQMMKEINQLINQ